MSPRGPSSAAVGLLALLACCGGCQAADRSAPATGEQRARDAVPPADPRPAAAELTLAAPRLSWPLAARADAGAAPIRHLEIVIDAIDNPRLVPLLFRVYAPDGSGNDRLLGSFAAYPPDRPGRFLVQVPPEVRLDDGIVLALAPAAEVSADDSVRVHIAEVTLLPRQD